MAKLKTIKIPASPRRSFDSSRRPSDLVMQQVRHAHEELRKWVEANRVVPEDINTEQEAANFINAVTRLLHPEGTPPVPVGIHGVDLGMGRPAGTKRRAGLRSPKAARRTSRAGR